MEVMERSKQNRDLKNLNRINKTWWLIGFGAEMERGGGIEDEWCLIHLGFRLNVGISRPEKEYMNRSGSRGGGSAVLRAEWDQTENLIGLDSQFCYINLVELFNHLELCFLSITCLIRALNSALHSIIEKFKWENVYHMVCKMAGSFRRS